VSTSESAPTTWSSGRYDAIGDHIAGIAADVVAAAKRRGPFRDVADLACGTGSAALVAAAAGARVTAVDVTGALIAIGRQKAQRLGHTVTWVTADASDTGLPAGAFDAVVSNMGIIFVEPVAQVAEIARLLKAGGVVGFSSWVPDPQTPFYKPIVTVLGSPPASGHSPDQWGTTETITDRLAQDFDDIAIETGACTWRLGTIEDAMHLLADESPIHVSLLDNLEAAKRDELLAAFEDAMRANIGADGLVAFDAPYLVVTARRR
jgi:SAM-dependent methyltransferase